MVLGICASVAQNSATNYAQAVLGILISFVLAGCMGPISYTIIAETSSVRLRALSSWRRSGRILRRRHSHDLPGFEDVESHGLEPRVQVWLCLGRHCRSMLDYGFLSFPSSSRSYREADILVNRRIPARKFKSTVFGVKDNE
jgi:MFS transporter, SP family, general alpha glucoside:H+ symporter